MSKQQSSAAIPVATALVQDAGATINLPISVSWEQLDAMLVNALEGGSNYWIETVQANAPKQQGVNCYEYLLREGRELTVYPDDNDGDVDYHMTLSRETATNALQLMVRDYPDHFKDVASQNDDAYTADIWLQLACFGEVVYG